jgi:hypothetical protein
MIKSMAQDVLSGKMVVDIQVYGLMVNSMEKEIIIMHQVSVKEVFGIMEKGKDG